MHSKYSKFGWIWFGLASLGEPIESWVQYWIWFGFHEKKGFGKDGDANESKGQERERRGWRSDRRCQGLASLPWFAPTHQGCGVNCNLQDDPHCKVDRNILDALTSPRLQCQHCLKVNCTLHQDKVNPILQNTVYMVYPIKALSTECKMQHTNSTSGSSFSKTECALCWRRETVGDWQCPPPAVSHACNLFAFLLSIPTTSFLLSFPLTSFYPTILRYH